MGKNNFEEVVNEIEKSLGKPIPVEVIRLTKMGYDCVESGKATYNQLLEIMNNIAFKKMEGDTEYGICSERAIQEPIATIN